MGRQAGGRAGGQAGAKAGSQEYVPRRLRWSVRLEHASGHDEFTALQVSLFPLDSLPFYPTQLQLSHKKSLGLSEMRIEGEGPRLMMLLSRVTRLKVSQAKENSRAGPPAIFLSTLHELTNDPGLLMQIARASGFAGIRASAAKMISRR